MREEYRTCIACGKTKPSYRFWRQAHRCRRCVARDAGRNRKARTRGWRRSFRKTYGLRIAISERRFGQKHAAARRKAESLVPKTFREHLSLALSIIPLPGLFGWPFLLWVEVLKGSTVLWVPGGALVLLLLFAPLIEKLDEPRKTAVREITDRILRDELVRFEAEQLEYLRFYLTPEWRHVRTTVIRRDGQVCNRCGESVRRRQDVTVDHILPRSVYPQLALDAKNLQVLCRACNSSKGAHVQPLKTEHG